MSSIHDILGNFNYHHRTAQKIIDHLVDVACGLDPHEQYCSALGIGEVWFTVLPNSILVNIFWNDGDAEDKEVLVPNPTFSHSVSLQLKAILNKYLRPELEKDLEWRGTN